MTPEQEAAALALTTGLPQTAKEALLGAEGGMVADGDPATLRALSRAGLVEREPGATRGTLTERGETARRGLGARRARRRQGGR